MYDKGITFCILSYNRPLHLARCIESCLLHGVGSKIIILDNSEDQASIKILQEQYPTSIDWYFSDQTLGYAKNFHRAFSVCKSRFLVALHDESDLLKSATNELHGCQCTQEEDCWHTESVECKPAHREDRINAWF